jgi:hypothetical protein
MTNDRNDKRREWQTTGNDKWQGTTNNREQRMMGNDERQGTTNSGEQRMMGNDEWQGTTNSGEQRMTGNNEQQGTMNGGEWPTNGSRTPPSLQTRDGGAISFLFLFQMFIPYVATPHRCEQLLAGCLCIYLFRIHN